MIRRRLPPAADAPICAACNGSGVGYSGPVDESRCGACGGRGVVSRRDEDEPSEDAMDAVRLRADLHEPEEIAGS